MGNGQGMKIKHWGHSVLISNTSNAYFHLHNLLHVPSIKKILVSVLQFAKDNKVIFEFHSNHCLVKSPATKEILLHGKIEDGLYAFGHVAIAHPSSLSTPITFNSQCNSLVTDFSVWHQRLGHISNKVVNPVLTKCNIHCFSNRMFNACQFCCIGKLHQIPYYASSTNYTMPLQLVDIWGPAPISISSGYPYYISFIDAYIRYCCNFLLNSKSLALKAFLQYKAFVELQTSFKIKAL